MPTFASVIAGSVFVTMGGLNVWIMLSNRDSSGHGRLWMRVHRMVGYLFIATFATTLFLMLQRLRGNADEVAPRILLFVATGAFILVVLGAALTLLSRPSKSEE